MTKSFRKYLLSELRMAVYQPGDPAELTDELLCEAVTLNENLQILGYILRPEDLLRLAVSPSLRGFYIGLKALVPDVTAQPMYPGFPQQVMAMSEAEFRLHQMLHYFSTYGLEDLLGTKVRRGWLPDYDGPERTESDIRLLESRVIELVSEQDAAFTALRTLLNRRERLTNPELELVLESAAACPVEQMQGLKVRFKENVDLLFPLLMEKAERETALCTLRTVCQHTGDVLRCAETYIRSRRYHLRTGEKKLLVKLLESYSVWNLRQNLMKSLRVREHSLMVLNHLDYNRFSRSAEHREAVRALRNGALPSWHGVGEALLRERDPKALAHLAERPGYMVRMLNRLLSLDYAEDTIAETLLPRADALSAHLLVRTVRGLNSRKTNAEEKLKRQKQELERELNQRLAASRAGQIRSEYEYRIRNCNWQYEYALRQLDPDEKRRISLWNCEKTARQRRSEARREFLEIPKERAETEAFTGCWALEDEIDELYDELYDIEDVMEDEPGVKRGCVLRDADHAFDELRAQYLFSTESFCAKASELRARIAFLSNAHQRERRDAERRCAQLWREIEVKNGILYADRIEEIDRWEQEERKRIEQDFERNQAELEENTRRLTAERDEELARLNAEMEEALTGADQECERIKAEFKKKETLLEGAYEAALRMSAYDPASVRILKRLLREHFRKASTPLKGKKVCCRLEQFDLKHSTLETEDRSRDGGYIRSGIAYRIPQNAKTVRFFVYWNDRKRVDIDLHVGGITTDGKSLHVGWNADCKNSGIVHSGDITHSDAAEYIDIDLSAPVKEIYANVHLYYGRPIFRYVETCYVGLMAVNKLGQTVKHYDPANCFFTHELTQRVSSLHYGYIDVQNRFVRFVGKPNPSSWSGRPEIEADAELFSLQDYLDCVFAGQEVQLVKREDQADLVLTMGKSLLDNDVSLVDNNFFLEC